MRNERGLSEGETAGERIKSVEGLLRRARVSVAPEVFALVGLSHEDWLRLLEKPELSPAPESKFMLLRDAHEVTLLVEEMDWRRMRDALTGAARVENDFRLLTFEIELQWNVVGFLARVAEILALAGVTIGALSAFSRDHLIIKQSELPRALVALREHVAELC